MKDFWSYAFWSGLAGIFAIALLSVVPFAGRLAYQALTDTIMAGEKYQVAAAASSPVVREELAASLNDPVFTPPEQGKAVRADLSAMKLSLYEDGESVATYDIVAKGKPGSYWETPTGEYQVLVKEETHYSALGQVWMPWSMQFFGNFFIHGRPYDETGKELPDGYSGGCIRLATPDAEAVYKFVNEGTLVSVYGGKTEGVATNHYDLIAPEKPKLSAQAYAAVDLETGEIIAGNNLDQVFPIASISKLLTAVVSLEIIDQESDVTISKAAAETYGTQGSLAVGEKLPAKELLYPLLLESSNDAAEALARHFGREQFILALNNKLGAIGLNSTHFDDPSGLSAENTSTARDLAKLARYIYQSKNFIFNLTQEKKRVYKQHVWTNGNKFVNKPNYLGGKNGYIDEAKQTQVALFDLQLSEFVSRPVAIVVLKSDNRQKDVETLVQFLDRHAVFNDRPKNTTFQYL